MLSRILHGALGRTGARGMPGPAVKLYSRVVVRLTGRLHLFLSKLLSRIVRRDGTIVDVGCGPGSPGVMLARRGFRNIILLDFSGATCESAWLNAVERGVYEYIDIVQGDAQMLPFRSGSCDAIVSVGTVHNLLRTRGFIIESYRALRRGGALSIAEMDYKSSYNDARALAEILKVRGIPKPLIMLACLMHGMSLQEFKKGSIGVALRKLFKNLLIDRITAFIPIVSMKP